MADLNDAYDALRNAHAAGDTAAAQKIVAYIQTAMAGVQPRQPDALDNPNMATEGMSGPQKFFAGAGKALTDLGRGAGQLVGMGPSQSDMTAIQSQDAPLMRTGAGLAGNVAGNVAATLPTLAIPGVNTYTGAMGLGSALAALQPTAEGESRAKNMAYGAVGGLAGQAGGNLISRALRPVQSTLNPEASRLAQVAADEGIPLDAAAATGSKPLKTINSVFENLPFTAGPQAAQNEARQAAFNSAVLKRAGINASDATPEVLGAQKAALGKIFNDISERNSLKFDDPLMNKLGSIAQDASEHLPPGAEQGVSGTIDKILSQVKSGDLMSGSNYQGWRTPLAQMAKKGDETSRYYGQIKSALDEAFGAGVSGADAEAWKQASREYGNLKTILKSMGGSGNAAQTGNISPAQLSMALRQAVGTEGKALGRGDLNDLTRVGNLFVRDQVPNSGTAQRALYQALMTGGGTGLGAGAAMATGHDPLEGAAYGAAGMGATLAGPRLVQAIIQSKPAQKYMIQQAGSPAAKALAIALQNGGRTLGAAMPAVYGRQ